MGENKYKHLVNRDLSWLKFNERVLEEAEDKGNPLFERLNFVSIYQSNLSEFLMVRVGGLHDRLLLKKDSIDEMSGMTTGEQLRAIHKEIRRLSPRKNRALIQILNELENYGIFYKTGKHLTKYEERFLQRYFERNVLPLLSPHIIDKHHPFPFLQNNTVHIAVLLKSKEGTQLGIIPASGYFERLLLMPSKYIKFTLIEDLIFHFAARVFPKHKIVARSIFTITRNADIDADEAFFDYDMSYRDIMEIIVKKRKRLEPVRLDISRSQNDEITRLLTKNLKLSDDEVFFNETPTILSFVSDLKDQLTDEKFAPLFYPPLTPQPSALLDPSLPLMAQVKKKDVLLSYPYQDMKTFVRLLDEAAADPKVISIKITLYRVARHSKVVDALIRAAENGKEVIAVVELRARFDEENNIDWSRRLQDAGVSLIYGIEDYKVHSKLLLITRKEKKGLSFFTQVGTGNYNESTAKLYTDLSLFTANEEIAMGAQDVFKNLCMGSLVENSDLLMVSPLTLKPAVLRGIDREIALAKSGAEAQLIFKLNSLNDLDIIRKLVEASDAGVKIRLLIRGICCLNVEETGRTRNIQVTSIVGRFLEHSRIYMFGTQERRRIYISSADFMTRNTQRRVEVAVPILDAACRQEIEETMALQLKDNVKARRQVGKGVYRKPVPDPCAPRIDSQVELFRRAYQQAGSPLPAWLKGRQARFD
ncbi:polyphosphate kinase 1 [Christensenella timonensis]|uniref:polyphosphate kinase 1 n=1 Tax=Christensenella timonensis TaxID=1816678 RepID=UPI00082AC654|nr:polyphosphate kinase 1 [Christensenella timonensis]